MIELLEQDCPSLSKLAERTGFPMSTAHRLLATLAQRGYVEQDPQARRTYLVSKLFALQTQFTPRRHPVAGDGIARKMADLIWAHKVNSMLTR